MSTTMKRSLERTMKATRTSTEIHLTAVMILYEIVCLGVMIMTMSDFPEIAPVMILMMLIGGIGFDLVMTEPAVSDYIDNNKIIDAGEAYASPAKHGTLKEEEK